MKREREREREGGGGNDEIILALSLSLSVSACIGIFFHMLGTLTSNVSNTEVAEGKHT